MNTYENISSELKRFFSSHFLFKVILPLDVIIMFGATGVTLLNNFTGIGSLICTLAYYLRLLGYLLTYANRKDQLLAGGFFLYAAGEGLYVLKHLFSSYSFLSWSSVIAAAIYGLLGYCILKKSYTNK